jgi:hypothetical protein
LIFRRSPAFFLLKIAGGVFLLFIVLRAVMENAPKTEREAARFVELGWQIGRLPDEIRELVLDDIRVSDDICWNIFTGAPS